MSSPPEIAPIPGTGGEPSVPAADGAPPGPASAIGLAIWSALLIVYVVWGSTYLAIRIAAETLPPLESAGVRFMAAGLVLAAVLAARGGPRRLWISRPQLGGCALIGGLLLVGGNGGVVIAESRPPGSAVPSGVAALLVALVPLLVVLLRAASGDRPRLTTVVGVGVGFAGLVALVAAGGGIEGTVPLGGAFIVVGAAAAWATGSFFSRRVPLPGDPFVATVYESLTGGAVLLLLGAARGERLDLGAVSTRSWVALLYLTVAGSLVAFTAYVWLLQHAPISLTATYAYVNPVVAVALGALVVAEPVTPAIVVGGLVIVIGVALVVSTERRGRARRARPLRDHEVGSGAQR